MNRGFNSNLFREPLYENVGKCYLTEHISNMIDFLPHIVAYFIQKLDFEAFTWTINKRKVPE